MINASSSASDYKPIDSGAYVARCYSMVHIGTIEQEFQGEKKEVNKVRISWELPTEMKVFKEGEEAKPLAIGKEFTLSLHEKANLRKFLESWRGKGFTEDEAKKFDITKLLGVPCMLSVIHKTSKQGKLYAEISSISTLPKGMACPEQINKNFEFTLEQFDNEKFDSLPDWLKDKIKTSKEYRAMNDPTLNDSAPDDTDDTINPEAGSDLPF
ncbi:MAG: hypothetical protein IPJ03_22360 [Ignavibacteriales bacterium]|nr:hypothetical protein [Ignavibacteriales bacterium]